MPFGSRSNPYIPGYGYARKPRPDLRKRGGGPAPLPPSHPAAVPSIEGTSGSAASSSSARRSRSSRRSLPSTSTASLTSLASELLVGGLNDLLEPDPHSGRVDLHSNLGKALQGLVRDGSELDRRLAVAVKQPAKRVDVLGPKTLGKVTVDQFMKASQKGTLKANQRGKLTIPATRKAARNLKRLREKKARIAAPLPGLDPHQTKVARIILRRGDAAGASFKEKLAAIETGLVESSLRNLGYGDADSEGWRQERTSIYGTGPTGPRNVRASADRFFHELRTDPGTATATTPGLLAQAAQGSAFPGRYDERAPEAKAILAAYERGGQPGPKLAAQLQAAKIRAQGLGIDTTPRPSFNGDVSPGGAGTVLVRADAKGMVNWAQSTLGTQEGSAKQIRWALASGVDPSVPWCSVWVAAGLARRGIQPPANPAYSGAWLEWSGGKRIQNLTQAKPGDLLIFDWGDGGITDHVALYAGNGQMIGGNQSDEVNQQAVPVEGIVGIVRPKYKGGAVRVSSAAPLPGGTPAGVGGVGAALGGAASAGGQVTGARQPAASSDASISLMSAPTAARASLPTAYQQFQGGSAEEGDLDELGGIIDGILRRRRL